MNDFCLKQGSCLKTSAAHLLTEGLKVDGYFFAIDCWRLFSENLVQEVTE